jgi:hypothetical protein
MNRAVDPTGAFGRAGADAMRHSRKVGSLWGRVMNQLEIANHLSRNQGILNRAYIYAHAAEMAMADSMVTAWEKVPDDKKEEVRKKWTLGKASAAASLKKLAIRAAAKAKAEAKESTN